MSWTYGNDPANSTLDAVRLLIGDTDTTDQQLSDQEINYFISLQPTSYGAAAIAARSLAAKYAKLVDKSVGDLEIKYSQRQRAFLTLADTLESQSALVGASPYLGGQSVADKETQYEDASKTQAYFARNQFDDPGADVLLDFDTSN